MVNSILNAANLFLGILSCLPTSIYSLILLSFGLFIVSSLVHFFFTI